MVSEPSPRQHAHGCVERGHVGPIDPEPRAGTVVEFRGCRPPENFHESREDLESWTRARFLNWKSIFQEIYGEPHCGRHRCVFIAGDYVYKLPQCLNGVYDNEWEGGSRSCHWATSWLWKDGDGFPILIMERVIPVVSGRHPDWVDAIDCQQVGYSKRTGRLVAYDFGYR